MGLAIVGILTGTIIPAILIGVGLYIFCHLDTIVGKLVGDALETIGPSVLGVEIRQDGLFKINIGHGEVDLNDLEIKNPEGFTATPHLLKIKQVRVNLNTWVLFKSRFKRIEVEEFILDGIDCNVEIRSLGKTNIQAILDHMNKDADPEKQAPKKSQEDAKSEEQSLLKEGTEEKKAEKGDGVTVILHKVIIRAIEVETKWQVTNIGTKLQVGDIVEEEFSEKMGGAAAVPVIIGFLIETLCKSILNSVIENAKSTGRGMAKGLTRGFSAMLGGLGGQAKEEKDAEGKTKEGSPKSAVAKGNKQPKDRCCDCGDPFGGGGGGFLDLQAQLNALGLGSNSESPTSAPVMKDKAEAGNTTAAPSTGHNAEHAPAAKQAPPAQEAHGNHAAPAEHHEHGHHG